MKIFILIPLIFVLSCTACIKKPTPILDKKTKQMKEPISCYYYRECEYYKTVDKKAHGDCKAEFIKCAKDLDYRFCSDRKYDKHTFENCFDKLQ